MSEWFYFGCGEIGGHYAFDQRRNKVYRRGNLANNVPFTHLDGTLPPHPETNNLYIASFSRLGGWGMSALSWWDRSVDTRPGSNSTIIAPSLVIEPQAMLTESQARFPWVFSRLPKPLLLLEPPSA